jgi:hypothetical protein
LDAAPEAVEACFDLLEEPNPQKNGTHVSNPSTSKKIATNKCTINQCFRERERERERKVTIGILEWHLGMQASAAIMLLVLAVS